MLVGPGHGRLGLLDELRSGSLTLGALRGSGISGVDITTDGANKFFHLINASFLLYFYNQLWNGSFTSINHN
jgi:hypothetical protein